MFGLLMGIAVGYMAFTENGRAIGNKVAKLAGEGLKKVMPDANKDEPTKQPARAIGNDSDIG